MSKHEPDCKLSRERMKVKDVEWSLCHLAHGHGSQDIKSKPAPEDDNMPGFQVAGNPFRPDPRSVENKGEGD
jgi:hypothetical protein